MLSDKVQKCLDGLGWSYRKGSGSSIDEYEVTSPCQILIRVEDLTGVSGGFAFWVSFRRESAIELRRVVGSHESDSEARQFASTFLKKLRDTLPQEPWKGTGFVREREQKSNWERLSEI